MIAFAVYGIPGPQGSKTYKGKSKKTGKAIMVESSAKVKPWREAVKWAASEAMTRHLAGVRSISFPLDGKGCAMLEGFEERNDMLHSVNHALPFDGPLVVRMVFTLPKPKSAPKRRVTYADRKPDLSKLARSTEDALTDAGLIADDALIVEFSRLAKVFPGEDPESLESPGVRITIAAKGEA